MTMSEVRALFMCANSGLVHAGEPPCPDLDKFIEENNIEIIDEGDSEPSSFESDCESDEVVSSPESEMSPLRLEDSYKLHPNSPQSRRLPMRLATQISVYMDMDRMGFPRNEEGRFNDWDVSKFCDSMNIICVCDHCSNEFV